MVKVMRPVVSVMSLKAVRTEVVIKSEAVEGSNRTCQTHYIFFARFVFSLFRRFSAWVARRNRSLKRRGVVIIWKVSLALCSNRGRQ